MLYRYRSKRKKKAPSYDSAHQTPHHSNTRNAQTRDSSIGNFLITTFMTHSYRRVQLAGSELKKDQMPAINPASKRKMLNPITNLMHVSRDGAKLKRACFLPGNAWIIYSNIPSLPFYITTSVE